MAPGTATFDREARTRRIIATICDVPAGRVASYGQIAGLAGITNGARQVGRALRELPKGSDVPWYRIVTASGRLAFAVGGEPWQRQCRKLSKEGVILRNDRVDMRRYQWQPDLDEILWKPSAAWD
ncbi:MAG: MGMT family protein [Woeseia sp.]